MNNIQTRPSIVFTLLTALAPIMWGSTYIVTTEVLPPDRPFTAALLRSLPAGILVILFTRHIPRRYEWGRLLVLSFLNIGLFQALLFLAAYRLPGGMAAVVGAIQPLLVMALVWAIDRKPASKVSLWAGVTGIVGMAALLLSPGSVWDPIGIISAFIGAASMATGTYLTRRWRLDMPVLALTGWQLLLGGILLAPVAWIIEPTLPVLSATQIMGYAYLSVFGALLGYALWFRGVGTLSPVAVSSLGLLSPLTAVVLGWLMLGQVMRGLSLAGAVMVLGSILAMQWSIGKQK